ncbi:hypothetical protein STRIP9103_05537 [Streptomyces ipomoeae 91-03]|uniref:Uncharacterized protein n=1 Tax=Streptomyces ipomoeae 91-03 TaxID=698759 RepID=L1KN78_9ACTN|nr:hypothetical protein STRIP9103_05537 [Streptomyces ipomoeae 91-03]
MQLGLDAPVPVGAVGHVEGFLDEQFQFFAPLGGRGFWAGSPVVVAGSGDAESAAHELDAVCVLLGVEPHLVDELVLACYRGSFAKYAAAFFRKVTSISSSRLRRSSSFRRARSFTVSSASGAGSCCFWYFFTQPRSVSEFSSSSRATSEIVLLDLNAIWTASSRNSGEYLLGGATSSSLPCSGQPYWVPVRKLRGPSDRAVRAPHEGWARNRRDQELHRPDHDRHRTGHMHPAGAGNARSRGSEPDADARL